MGHGDRCILRPDLTIDEAEDPINRTWAAPEKIRAIKEKRLYHIQLELTSKCAGSCVYCYSSSDNIVDYTIPKEKIFEVIDIGEKMGVKEFGLDGGDPTAHPDWYEVASYASEKGMAITILPPGLISKKLAKELASLPLDMIGHHLDSLNPEIYNKVHVDPRTREIRIQGYRNLLEAGIKPELIVPVITLTSYSIQTVEETLDWFVDEMGCKYVCMTIFRTAGFGDRHRDLEPSLSDIRRAFEYRAKKLGEHWRKIGTTDATKFFCQGYVSIQFNGNIGCCPCIRDADTIFGNIYQDDLQEVIEKHREEIMFDFPIEGACGSCANSDLCFGCRANAYFYTGSVRASDPRCPWNPNNPEYYLTASGDKGA